MPARRAAAPAPQRAGRHRDAWPRSPSSSPASVALHDGQTTARPEQRVSHLA